MVLLRERDAGSAKQELGLWFLPAHSFGGWFILNCWNSETTRMWVYETKTKT